MAVEERFRAVVEYAPDAILATGHQGTITLVNRQAERLFGYAREELLGQPLHHLVPDWFQETFAEGQADGVLRPPFINRALVGRRRDGSAFPVAVSLGPLPLASLPDDQHSDHLSFIATIREAPVNDNEHQAHRMLVARLRASSRAQGQLHVLESRPAIPASAEATAEELTRLQALTDTALARLKLDDLLRELLDGICTVMGVADAGILLLDDDGKHLRLAGAQGLEDAVAASARIPVGQGFSGRIAATRAPLIVDDVPSFETYYSQMRETQRSAMGVPLLVGERVVGVVYVGSGTPHEFTQEDVALLQRVANRTALAIDRSIAYEAAEAVRAEAEQKAEQLERIIDTMADAVVVYDAEGRIQRVNATARGLLGLDAAPPEYAHLSLAERHALVERRDEQGQSLTFEDFAVVRALHGETVMGANAVVEHLPTPNGNEVVTTTSAAPLRDRAGQILGAVAILRDITERKRAEGALRASDDRYRAVVETQTDLITRFLPDSTMTFVNEANCRTMGKSREELLGTKLLDLLPDSAREQVHAAIHSLLAQPGMATVEHEIKLPDGSTNWQRWVNRSILDERGEVIEIQGVGHDITEYKAMQRALEESEARYRDLVESQTEMVCRYRPDGTLTFVNAAYSRFWGRPREELIGRPFFDLLPNAQAERARRNLDRMLEHPDVIIDEHEVVLPEGSEGWQQWIEHAILDADGKVAELQAIGRDITDRKRAEAALRESEALFRAAFESAAIGMMLVGPDGRAFQVNRPVVDMLGYSAEEFRTQSFASFTHPDDVEPNLTLFRQALAGERDSYQVEKRFVHKQGHVVWGRVSAGVVRDEAGQPLYVAGHLENITSYKQAEQDREAVRAATERHAEELDRIFEAMADGVVVFDGQGRMIHTNAAARQLLGLESASPDHFTLSAHQRIRLFRERDAEGRNLTADELPSMRALRGEVLTGANAMHMLWRTLDGRELELGVSAAPLRDADGHIIGGVMVVRDRTERNRLLREREEARASELAAREMNQRLDTSFAIAGHDLRQSATLGKKAVQAAQTLILEAAKSVPSSSGKYTLIFARVGAELERTCQSLVRHWRLVHQLTDVSQARQGTLQLERELCDLGELVRQGVREQQQLAPARTLTVRLPASFPVVVNADATRLGQVISNYLSNAVRYTPESQPIAVTLRVVGEGAEAVARVEVRDFGPGIAPEDRDKIWARFQQAHSVEESSGGLGLGLYIAKLIVECHGGAVDMESEVGRGSTFSFTVPLPFSDAPPSGCLPGHCPPGE